MNVLQYEIAVLLYVLIVSTERTKLSLINGEWVLGVPYDVLKLGWIG